jgi:DNA-directed RNA polymerase I, II, and III subunit RPABC1
MDELFDPVYTSPGLTTGEGCIVVKHMRPSPQSGSESISADDLKQFLSPGGQFQVSTQAIESGKHRAIIITKVKLSSAFEDLIRSENEKGLYIIEHFLEKELGFNITKHSLVPQHEKLAPEQKKELLRRCLIRSITSPCTLRLSDSNSCIVLRYKLAESHLPRVHKADPIARYFGMQKGDVFRIVRPSETAGRYVTYRIVL